jgi:hypothetical protein
LAAELQQDVFTATACELFKDGFVEVSIVEGEEECASQSGSEAFDV